MPERLKTEKPIKNDRFVIVEMDALKARVDSKAALELAILNTQITDILASNLDSDSREQAIVELQASRLSNIQLTLDSLRREYLGRLKERSRHIVNYQLIEDDLEAQSTGLVKKRMERLQGVLPAKAVSEAVVAVATPTVANNTGGEGQVAVTEVAAVKVTGEVVSNLVASPAITEGGENQ